MVRHDPLRQKERGISRYKRLRSQEAARYMPNFEEILDDLAIDLAVTKCDKSYHQGYKKGKTRARIEVAVVFAVIYFGIAAIGLFHT